MARSRSFDERALQPFGVRVVQSSQGPGFALDDQDFWIMEQEVAAGSVHIAFAAPDRETVDAFHAAAVEAGGVDNGRFVAGGREPASRGRGRASSRPGGVGRCGRSLISSTIAGGGFSPSRKARSASKRGQSEQRGRTPL